MIESARARCYKYLFLTFADVAHYGASRFRCHATSDSTRGSKKQRGKRGGGAEEWWRWRQNQVECAESLSAIGKQQARFIGSLMQRGSAFRQPTQIERTASADRLPGNCCTFLTKSRITTQPPRLRHPRKSLCSQELCDSVARYRQ